jgi:proteic killer suppression protein
VGFPPRLRLGAGLLEVDFGIDVIHPGERNEVVLATGGFIALCELHLIGAFHVVDCTDMDAVRADDFHMLVDQGGLNHCAPPSIAPNGELTLALDGSRMINNARTLDDLRVSPGNRLEALAKDRRGQHSIPINDQWRICFVWRDGHAHQVEIVDYH